MTMRVEWHGIEVLAAVSRTVEDGCGIHARLVAGQASRIAPSKSGRLARSIVASPATRDGDGARASVSSGMAYAMAVEVGTDDSPAQPYLRPAADDRTLARDAIVRAGNGERP